MTAHLHIERLILEGFDLSPQDVRGLHASLERELVRLLEQGTLDRAVGGAVPFVRADAPASPAMRTPDGLGRAIAASIHRGVTAAGSGLPPEGAI